MEDDRQPQPEQDEENDVGLRRVRKPNLWVAMAAYAGIAILAGLTLNGPTVFEERLRAVVWLLLGALAVRTWIHSIRERH